MLLVATMSSLPNIDLPKAVHFMTPNDEDVMVGPGTYTVEATEQGLRLTSQNGKADDRKNHRVPTRQES